MKIVLDTNILINCFLKKSINYWIWQELEKGGISLCYSHDIILEYEEVLTRKYKDDILVTSIIEAILFLPNSTEVKKSYYFNLISKDPDDNKFSDCAIISGCGALVSNDNHFNILRSHPFPLVKVLNEDEFKIEFYKMY